MSSDGCQPSEPSAISCQPSAFRRIDKTFGVYNTVVYYTDIALS